MLNYGDGGLTLYDLAGTKRIVWDEPPLWSAQDDVRLDTGMSCTGWLAVRTARQGDPPIDIAISILRLPADQPFRTIPLLPSDYAERFQASGSGEAENWRNDDLYQMTLNRLTRPRWSPDGQYLAFAAALEGSSTDLYVYDANTDAIHRLSDETEHVVIFGWSPDSRWIVYAAADAKEDLPSGYVEAIPVGYKGVALHAAAVESDELQQLIAFAEPRRFKLLAWTSPTGLLLALYSELGLPIALRTVDLGSSKVQSLYDGPFMRADADGKSGTVVITAHTNDQVPGGSYLIDAARGEPLLIRESYLDFPYSEFVAWSPQLGQYLVESHAGVLVLEPSGEIAQTFAGESCLAEVSPDGQWLAFSVCDEWSNIRRPGLRLYRTAGQRVATVSSSEIRDIAWRSDSAGFFYVTDSARLEYYDLAGNQTRIIDDSARPFLIMIPSSSFLREP